MSIALLKPFSRYLKKYIFFIVFSSLFISLISFFAAIETNMSEAAFYYYKSAVAGDVRIDPSCIIPEPLFKSIISECEKENSIEITSFHFLYPTVSVYIECDNGKREYLNIQPRSDLRENEVLLLGGVVPSNSSIIYDSHTDKEYEIFITTNKERAMEESVGIHEAVVSEDLYWEIASLQGLERNNCIIKAIFTYDGEVSAEKFFKSYIRRETELITKGQLKKILNSAQLYLNKNGRRAFQTAYSYDYNSKSFSSNNTVSLLSNHYNTDLVNEIDRLNGPKIFIIKYGVLLIVSICISLVFTEVSILKLRKKEFSLNSTLGMKSAKQIKILFEEKLVIFILLVLTTLVLTVFLLFLSSFYSSKGAQLVFGEDLYMRDLFSLDGKYDTSGIFLYVAVLFAIFFVGIYILTFFTDFIFLRMTQRRQK